MTQHVQTMLPSLDGNFDPYQPGMMLPAVHYRIVEELDRIASEAGISPRDITGHDYAMTDAERSYLKGFRRATQNNQLGLIYVGRHDPAVVARCRSICGALIRNFISAQLMPREVLVDALFGNSSKPHAALVAVPDFHYADAPVATRRALASWLLGRVSRGEQTVLGVPNPKVLKELCGDETDAYLDRFSIVHGVAHNPA